ncbi:MAG TPA: triose-phosphate isomerase [Alloiococcus sp.]|nr:triose-phosphate isomerase [Alloiococcus sp.]
MRKPIIAGNWKMNKTAPEVESFITEVKGNIPSSDKVEAVIGAPNIFTQSLVDMTADSDIKVAAQNCFYEDSGSYTGETSPLALADLGTDYVIIGHSERREIFHETDEDVNKKAKAIFNNSMLPIICVGESLETKEAGKTNEFVANQVKAALEGLTGDQVKQSVLAYEPIWAIGSGKTATAEDANETIKVVRQTVADLFDQDVADAVRIQYGGSVKPENIADFLATSDIDGALVGGASLESDSFLKLLEAVK